MEALESKSPKFSDNATCTTELSIWVKWFCPQIHVFHEWIKEFVERIPGMDWLVNSFCSARRKMYKFLSNHSHDPPEFDRWYVPWTACYCSNVFKWFWELEGPYWNQSGKTVIRLRFGEKILITLLTWAHQHRNIHIGMVLKHQALYSQGWSRTQKSISQAIIAVLYIKKIFAAVKQWIAHELWFGTKPDAFGLGIHGGKSVTPSGLLNKKLSYNSSFRS
jgi:hypothetical protein